jgi:hypothetical protein
MRKTTGLKTTIGIRIFGGNKLSIEIGTTAETRMSIGNKKTTDLKTIIGTRTTTGVLQPL